MIIKSFDLFEFDLEKLSRTKWFLGITIGGLVLVKYLSFDKKSEIAIFPYPNNKRENFRIITKAARHQTLPKILLTDGFFPLNVRRVVVLTDFDVIDKAFKNPVFSSKVSNPKSQLDFELEREQSGLPEYVNQIGLKTGNTKKALASEFRHIAAGHYDQNHILLRKRWHAATSKLLGKNKIDEMCDFSSNQIVESIQSEMIENPTGFDPEYVFMNASLNVTSAFCLNESYDFGDSEQLKLLNWIETFFDKIADLFLINAFTSLFPTFMIRRGIPRAILTAFTPDRYVMRSIMYKEIVPFFCKKMKEHEDTIDPESPRDYLDYLILEARENDKIGYISIALTIWFLYVGGGDTLATTMRWLCLVLTVNPDIQEKCHEELDKCFSENGKFESDECPYFNAVLQENLRFRPVGDSLLHRCIQDTELDGYLIKKGSLVQASLLSVMHNPIDFPQPEVFKPERFLVNGQFQKNPKVCPFSLGLRNCVGKRLAQMEYFSFSAQLIHKFKITSNEKIDLEPTDHISLLSPANTNLIFTER